MRKWYGAGERAPREAVEEEPEEPVPESGDVVLVTGVDSPLGEQAVLQLILARQQVRVLVRDTAAAKNAYGPYVEPLSADADPARALRGVKCLVAAGGPLLGRGLLAGARRAGVRHVVALAAAAGAAGGGGLLGLLPGGGGGAELRALPPYAEAVQALKAAGVPYTVVQVHGLTDGQPGASRVALQPVPAAAAAAAAPVSRAALGSLLRALVDAAPAGGGGRCVVAAGAGPGGQSEEELLAALAAIPEQP